jgi:tRNA (guanine-N7-)-methyltransferase
LQVRFVDVGCGFGGLLIRLAPLYPDKLMLGFELRDKVRFNDNAVRLPCL